MITIITSFIKKHALIKPKDHLIIGLSGGPDSVFLLYVMHHCAKTYDISLTAAHLDHEWRKEAPQDMLFCQALCQSLGIPFISKKASELSITVKKNGSLEAWGRILRRTFLEEVLAQMQATSIALAHHADDQEETFFLRLIRGTTLSGIVGMQPKSGPYIRPLLLIKKEDILAYLHEHGISYRVDPTNNSQEYLRNKIRLNVLPALKETDSRFSSNFLRTLESFQEAENFLHKLTLETLIRLHNDEGTISLAELQTLDLFLQKRVLLQWLIEQKVPFTPTQGLIEEILRFLSNSKHSRHSIHEQWAIVKKGDRICIEKSSF